MRIIRILKENWGILETDESKRLKEEFSRIDAEIDKKVYDLYGISKFEQEIIEKNE